MFITFLFILLYITYFAYFLNRLSLVSYYRMHLVRVMHCQFIIYPSHHHRECMTYIHTHIMHLHIHYSIQPCQAVYSRGQKFSLNPFTRIHNKMHWIEDFKKLDCLRPVRHCRKREKNERERRDNEHERKEEEEANRREEVK